MDALEKALGVALFTRSQTGLLPTEAALALQPFAQAMSSSAARAEARCREPGLGHQGTVRVTASEGDWARGVAAHIGADCRTLPRT